MIGVGTRYSDFTTGVQDRLRRPGRAVRQPQRGVVRRPQAVGRARWSATRAPGSSSSPSALAGWQAPAEHTDAGHAGSPREWDDDRRSARTTLGHGPLPAQSEVLGVGQPR